MTAAISRVLGVSALINTSAVSYYLRLALLLSWIPLTLFFLLFAPIPALHDNLHALRHSLANVPCH